MAHAYLDKFTVIAGCLVAEGWATDFDPQLYYDGQPIGFSTRKVDRTDLVGRFGEEARSWGFILCAALPSGRVRREKFVMRFNADITLDQLAERFAAPADVRFIEMTSDFHRFVNERPGPFLEIGSRARSGAAHHGWLPDGIRYVGMDVMAGPNVEIVGDAHELSTLTDDKFDYIFSIAVFEHLLMPWKVAIEMNKVMNMGGYVMTVSHNAWPLHDEPWDFWRFSREAWNGIFNTHTGFEIVRAEYQHPVSIIPDYINTVDTEVMWTGDAYLASGCVVRKIGVPSVSWDGRTSDVYDLGYDKAGATAAHIER